MVSTDISLQSKHKSQIKERIDEIDQTMTAKLDNMEQAVRDLLQIVRWLSEFSCGH